MAISDKKVAFLLTNGVEQVELTSPREALDAAGATTEIVAPEGDTIQAMVSDWDHGENFLVDRALSEADPADYDLLVLPGGTINADTLRANEAAQKFVHAFVESGKPVAAICHAPWILTNTDDAKGKHLTSYHTLKTDLTNAGADWADEEVVVDGNLITSRSPKDLDAFNAAIADKLS